MLTITWHGEKLPAGIPITQVYGLVFDREGRMLLEVENKRGSFLFPNTTVTKKFGFDKKE